MTAYNIPEEVFSLVYDIRDQGGKAYLVGGGVVDLIQGRDIKDWDLEVFGLSYQKLLESAEEIAGKADLIGQKFGVVKVVHNGIDIELSVPRWDNHTGPKHKDFDIELVPDMSVKEAARRRDFTINAISYDIETGIFLDPFDGMDNLRFGKLHPVDKTTFTEDPLRAFRAVQLVARKARSWTIGLHRLVCSMHESLKHLTGDVILGEMNKLLMLADQPSIGLKQMGRTESEDIYDNPCMIRLFPELETLIGCKQWEKWHPEGDAWVHTLMVVDKAARYRDELPEEWRLPFMWGMLLHDVGKAVATRFDKEKGHLTSINHDKEGEPLARAFMKRLTTNQDLINKVCAIVKVHMRPRLLLKSSPRRATWRRLQNVCPLNILAYVSIADGDGRGRKAERLGKEDPVFIKTMEVHRELGSPASEIKPILMVRHLIERGMKPGVKFGPILEKAYNYQIEFGHTNIDILYDMATRNDTVDISDIYK
jgi:tRNA nucleotidyltransferase (CCA-adding enzyme)